MTSPAVNDPHLAYGGWRSDPGEVGTSAGVMPQHIIRFMRARGWIVALTTAICLLCGVLYLMGRSPVYVSTAELIVDPREVQGVSGNATPRTENADATEAMVGNEMRVLKSSTLLSTLVDKDDLVHDPDFTRKPSPIGELRGILDETLGHAQGKTAPVGDAKLETLAKLDDAIAVRRAERSFVVDVTVKTSNADKSARLANDLVALYIEQAVATASGLNRRVGDSLQARLSELQARLNEADQQVEQFRIANHLVSAGGVLTSDLRLRTLTDQLSLAQTREDEDRARADEVARLTTERKLGTAPEAQQSAAVNQLRSRLADAIAKATTLSGQLGARHPDLLAAREQVMTTQRLLDAELQRVAQATRNQYGRSRENAATLRQGVDTLSTTSLNNSATVAQLRQLEQEAEAARALFTAFLSRSRELSEQTQVYTSNTRQIGTALPALGSSTLSGTVVLLVSGVLGLVLGGAIAALLELRGRLLSGPAPTARRSYIA